MVPIRHPHRLDQVVLLHLRRIYILLELVRLMGPPVCHAIPLFVFNLMGLLIQGA